ncbi:MAG: hypothetical protein SFX73_12005 [Kofleriaceae bacterium]|nr:hypothetical protein [Kofleriaceae bacterium]
MTTTPACPSCGVRAGAPTDPIADVVAAAEQLARAIARATPVELAKAQAELAVREAVRPVPTPKALPHIGSSLMRAVRTALASAPVPVDAVVTGRAQTALLTTAVLALLTRVQRRAWAAKALRN